MSQNQSTNDYVDNIANTGALVGIARTILLGLSPADAVATCVFAVRLLASMEAPSGGLKPFLRHLKGVCAGIIRELGEAANIPSSEDGEWALDLIGAYSRVGLGAPGILHTIVEVCLGYIVKGDQMFVRSMRDIGGGERAEVSDNDLLLMLPKPLSAPPEMQEIAGYVYAELYTNMKAFADAAAAAGRSGKA